MTVMAFDFGLSQIGVATGNTLLGTSDALPVLRARDGVPAWGEVEALLGEWQPDLLLVGDPLNMDGSAGDSAERARKFARRLHGRFGLEVVMVDERLSSYEAKREQREAGHRGDFKRRPVDSLAAQLILRTWLEQRAAAAD
ncbi:MAG: Holliday junction resolvase RuvX [Halioglobus sp.]|nr:Holliday junction resolvase RuvX [Halioglobus sp.]